MSFVFTPVERPNQVAYDEKQEMDTDDDEDRMLDSADEASDRELCMMSPSLPMRSGDGHCMPSQTW
jgi:hypothetical protein